MRISARPFAAVLCAATISLMTTNLASADTTVVMLVPPSFSGAFRDIAAEYEKSHPGTHIQVSPAASKVIEDELAAGAAGDLAVMGADLAEKSTLIEHPVPLIADHTTLTAIPHGKVTSAKDLAKPGVRLSWGIKDSITAKFDDDTLANLAKIYGPQYASAVQANILVHKSVGLLSEQAVEEGTVDAAIVLKSNTTNGKTTVIDLGKASVAVIFYGGVAKAAKNPDVARAIIALVQSPAGHAILQKHHQALDA
jgi:molybdate transport system substrate-binding protein